jgi:ABC-type polysaccharide/polyol phosphate transport system ATPase subunit
MASIELDNVSVSYFLHKQGTTKGNLERGSVGAPILVRNRYLEIAALKNVSLSIKDGDRVGLIGINGSGKSTLLKLCAGGLSAQSGTLRIDGRVSPQFSLGAGMKGSLSGRRNAELKALYMRMAQRSIAARVEEVKALSGLGGYFELPVSSYSAGMRSRLVMSMISLVKADILVMDEWIGAADATVNSVASALQTDLVQSASILVVASHSERILKQWTNRLVWLEQGEVRMSGPFDEVYPEYTRFLGKNVQPAVAKRRPAVKRERLPSQS